MDYPLPGGGISIGVAAGGGVCVANTTGALTPDDVAQACLFLASPGASYVSGTCLTVHGGGEPPAFLSTGVGSG